jgi:thiol-disulfide isomerase/thioredoxin
MAPRSALLGLFVPVLVAAAPAASAPDRAGVEAALRGRVLHAPDGRSLRLDDCRGDVVVLNFWASWCKPCRKEMPLLDRLHSRIASSSGRVVAISVDREPRRAAAFLEEHSLTLPAYVDGPDGLAAKMDLPVLPYTVVLDRAGRVAFAGPVTPAGWGAFERMVVGLLGGNEAVRAEAAS